MKIKTTEHEEQKTVIEYCNAKRIPVIAIPNAQALSFLDRKLAMKIMAKLKAEGLAKGFPDLLIPIVTNKGGLFIEMKSKTGIISPEQKDWINHLNNNGYQACVCFGADNAINVIDDYLSFFPKAKDMKITTSIG